MIKAEEITSQIREIFVSQQFLLAKSIKKYDLSPQQAAILSYIEDHPNIIQKDLAFFLNRKAATVSSLITNLEKNNFLTRQTNEKNAKNKILVVTELGRKVILEFKVAQKNSSEKLVSNFSEQEMQSLSKLLGKIDLYNK